MHHNGLLMVSYLFVVIPFLTAEQPAYQGIQIIHPKTTELTVHPGELLNLGSPEIQMGTRETAE